MKGEDSWMKYNHEMVAGVQCVSHWCASTSIGAKGWEFYFTGGGLHHFDMT
jgi:hypothetical protein